MTLVSWFDVVVVGLVVGLLVQFSLSFRQSPEDLGYALLKQKAAALGVDVNRIPDPAWHAIVDMSIALVRDRAARHQASRQWQAYLAGTLEEEAMEISKFLNRSPCSRHSAAPYILLEYRV